MLFVFQAVLEKVKEERKAKKKAKKKGDDESAAEQTASQEPERAAPATDVHQCERTTTTAEEAVLQQQLLKNLFVLPPRDAQMPPEPMYPPPGMGPPPGMNQYPSTTTEPPPPQRPVPQQQQQRQPMPPPPPPPPLSRLEAALSEMGLTRATAPQDVVRAIQAQLEQQERQATLKEGEEFTKKKNKKKKKKGSGIEEQATTTATESNLFSLLEGADASESSQQGDASDGMGVGAPYKDSHGVWHADVTGISGHVTPVSLKNFNKSFKGQPRLSFEEQQDVKKAFKRERDERKTRKKGYDRLAAVGLHEVAEQDADFEALFASQEKIAERPPTPPTPMEAAKVQIEPRFGVCSQVDLNQMFQSCAVDNHAAGLPAMPKVAVSFQQPAAVSKEQHLLGMRGISSVAPPSGPGRPDQYWEQVAAGVQAPPGFGAPPPGFGAPPPGFGPPPGFAAPPGFGVPPPGLAPMHPVGPPPGMAAAPPPATGAPSSNKAPLIAAGPAGGAARGFGMRRNLARVSRVHPRAPW